MCAKKACSERILDSLHKYRGPSWRLGEEGSEGFIAISITKSFKCTYV